MVLHGLLQLHLEVLFQHFVGLPPLLVAFPLVMFKDPAHFAVDILDSGLVSLYGSYAFHGLLVVRLRHIVGWQIDSMEQHFLCALRHEALGLIVELAQFNMKSSSAFAAKQPAAGSSHETGNEAPMATVPGADGEGREPR